MDALAEIIHIPVTWQQKENEKKMVFLLPIKKTGDGKKLEMERKG